MNSDPYLTERGPLPINIRQCTGLTADETLDVKTGPEFWFLSSTAEKISLPEGRLWDV